MSLREEMARKEQEKKNRRFRIIYVLIATGVVVSLFNLIIGMVIVVPLVIFVIANQTMKDIKHESQDFDGKIKNEMGTKILKEVLPEVQRFVDEGLPQEEYILSEFVESCAKYKSQDKMIIPLTVDGNAVTNIELYDLSHEITDEANDSFYGIYARTRLSKDVRTKIKISSEGKYADGNIFKYEMDNKEFESVFDVMAMNQNTVRNILTEEIMEYMLGIYKKYKYIVEISIIKNMLHVRVVGKPKIIQVSYGSEIDKVAVDNHYNIMKELNELIHKIYANVDNLHI